MAMEEKMSTVAATDKHYTARIVERGICQKTCG
jgi:hypothetical protein